MMEVQVKVRDGASQALAGIIDSLEGPQAEVFNQVGGRAANTEAIEYHQEFNQAGKWKGSGYLSGPGRQSGEFGQNVALGWNFRTASPTGATISNNADYYAFKVTGGTIVPKRVKNLTIPMVSEAVGRRARDYESTTGRRLFTILGKKALFEKQENGGIRAVYALVQRVTQQPWPKALPPNSRLANAFAEAWLGALGDEIQKS